ncbi:SulP family inorganic anion transporter [uncultured Nitrospira sp.]|uniref:SulP family inorganic anion transporter n=1 Tax=uncultured Nitrospira sp. TaxID=157176 RepID=UPI00314064A4
MRLVHGLHFNNLRGDVYGGLVAAVVALPLALAFGVASGLGAIAGLYGAIFVGFFAALFGGTPAQVSGPTGPMTVVMAGIVTLFLDNPGLALMAVILGGGFQILLGLSRVGQYIALVPYPVVSGFMSGIGCIILILQLGPLVGHAASPEGVVATLKAIPRFYGEPVWDAALASGLVLVIVYFTPSRIAKLVPPSLLALLVVTPLAYVFLPDAPIIGEVPQGFPAPLMPTLSWDTLNIVLESAVTLALLGAIDSLLTSLVCDNMTRTQHDPDRELIGQGIGNMVAGVFGGIPGAGATMRSVANIRTGGRTPISGALHAVILVAILLGLGPLAEKIPLAVLGGILFKVGIDIIDWRFLRHILRAPRIDVVIMTVVLLTTVLVDLITAVAVGMIFASLFFVKRMADLELANLHIVTKHTPSTPLLLEEAMILEQANDKILLIHVDGPMSFGSAKNMVRRLETVPGFNTFSSVVLDLSKVSAIDGTAALAVEDMLNIIKAHQQHLFFVGMQPHVTKALDGLGVLEQIRPGHRFASRLEALQKASMVEHASIKSPSETPTPKVNLPETS